MSSKVPLDWHVAFLLKKFLCWLFFSLDISNNQYKL